ncbi:MAG: hypothetical protein WC262_10650 [Bacteroidales bacterium]|jgi:hypothetical protein
MSAEIRKYQVQSDLQADNFDMHVIALMGSMQPWTAIEIDHCRCTLSEEQVLDLISVLSRRLLKRKGFGATDCAQTVTVTPDGSMMIEEEAGQ